MKDNTYIFTDADILFDQQYRVWYFKSRDTLLMFPNNYYTIRQDTIKKICKNRLCFYSGFKLIYIPSNVILI